MSAQEHIEVGTFIKELEELETKHGLHLKSTHYVDIRPSRDSGNVGPTIAHVSFNGHRLHEVY